MFQQYTIVWGMTLSAFIVAFLLYFIRRKTYFVSWCELFAIAAILAIGGTIGGSIASIIVQGYADGRRAYGIILLDTILLLPFIFVKKYANGRLTDFAAIPAQAICCIGKLQCCIDHCCYGITIFELTNGKAIRFPSEILEEITLLIILIWLLYLEKNKKATGFLWSLHVLWYGITRYIADLFRGNPKEHTIFLLGMRPGQFWSIVIVLAGLYLLGNMFKKQYGRKLENKELFNAMIGKFPSS